MSNGVVAVSEVRAVSEVMEVEVNSVDLQVVNELDDETQKLVTQYRTSALQPGPVPVSSSQSPWALSVHDSRVPPA